MRNTKKIKLAAFLLFLKSIRTVLFLLIFSIFSVPCFSTQGTTPRVQFPLANFSIDPLEHEIPTSSYTPLMMFLPGSISNINVLIQPFDGTMDEYSAITRKQLESLGWTLINEKLDTDFLIYEYSGVMEGTLFHWYARVEFNDGRAYVITATSRSEDWSALSRKFIACVNSFKFNRVEKNKKKLKAPSIEDYINYEPNGLRKKLEKLRENKPSSNSKTKI